MKSNRTYRKLFTPQNKKRFAYQSKKKSFWIDILTERHARIIALLFFIGIGLTYSIGVKTLATWSTISRFFFALAVVTSFIPSNFFPLIYRIRKEMKVLFTVFGLSPLLTGFILLLNFAFVHDLNTESYKIEKVHHYSNDYLFIVNLENNAFDKFNQLRTFSSDEYKFYPDSAHYRIGTGCFYLKVARNAYLSP